MINKFETGTVAYINEETKEGVFSYISNTGRRYEEKTSLEGLNERVEQLVKMVNGEIKQVEKEQSKISKTIEKFKNKISEMMKKDKEFDRKR